MSLPEYFFQTIEADRLKERKDWRVRVCLSGAGALTALSRGWRQLLYAWSGVTVAYRNLIPSHTYICFWRLWCNGTSECASVTLNPHWYLIFLLAYFEWKVSPREYLVLMLILLSHTLRSCLWIEPKTEETSRLGCVSFESCLSSL